MTAVAIETSVLGALDFEIPCQATYVIKFLPRMSEIPDCDKAATHTASIHRMDCSLLEKFLCEDHATRAYQDSCWECGTVPRIKDVMPIGSTA